MSGAHAGMEIGGFVLGTQLGGRGDRSVWSARHSVLRQRAVVRCTAVEHGQSPLAARHALRAARSHESAAETHPAFVRPLGAGTAFTTGGRIAYAVYECIEGRTIERALRERRVQAMSPRSAFELLGPVAEALHLLHMRGAAHGDLDGSRIIMPASSGSVRIFGMCSTVLAAHKARASDVAAFMHVLLELLAGRTLLSTDRPERALGESLRREMARAACGDREDMAALWGRLHRIFSDEDLWDRRLVPSEREHGSGVSQTIRLARGFDQEPGPSLEHGARELVARPEAG